MTAVSALEDPISAAPGAGLGPAANPLARVPNPFGHTIVRDAWRPADIDVPEIHAEAYARCLAMFQRVASGQGSESVLLHGPAGSGKTHLLGRLQRHLIQTAREAPDRALRCVFISVKLQTSARMLWQHLRRRLADDLLRVEEGASQLQRLVAHFLAAGDSERRSPRAWVRRIRVLSQIEDPEVEALLDRIADRAELSRDLRRVLGHLVHGHSVSDARAWLAGEHIPEAAGRRLGLGRDVLLEQDPEYAARETILSICRLAGESLPLVFCFDQIEALEPTAVEDSAFRKFADLVASIFNSTDNTLLISCVQSALADRLKDAARDADRDRLARREATLDPLTRDEAMLLLDRRLDAVPEIRSLRGVHREHPHWPLAREDLDPIFAAGQAVTARRVLSAAERVFEQIQTGRAPPGPPPHAEFLRLELERRVERALAESKPGETEAVLRHALPLAVEVVGAARDVEVCAGHSSGGRWPGWRLDGERADRDLEMGFDRPDGAAVGVSVCCHENMTQLCHRLRRLRDRAAVPGGPRVVLVRDPRLPIRPTAGTARRYLDELRARGVPLVRPSVEALALLQAVRTLISDARAGDLDNAGAGVPPAVLQAWLAEHLAGRIEEILRDVLDPAPLLAPAAGEAGSAPEAGAPHPASP